MKCIKCSHSESKVVESRDIGDGSSVRRRRQCLDCEHRFTTYERVEVPYLMVSKKNGTQELFDRAKLLSGLNKAIQKCPVNPQQLEELVDDVERSIHELGETEIASYKVGEMVMERLMYLDEVAYIRFASVYRSFGDIESFEQELRRVKSEVKNKS